MPVSATVSGRTPSVSLERVGLEVDVHEDERPPRVHLDGEERVVVGVEAGLALGARRLEQAAVEPVRPRVVGTLQRLAVPGALHDDVAAMAADVDEALELALLVPDEDDRDGPGLGGEVVAGLAHLGRHAGVLPGVLEDPLALEREDGAVRIPARGQRVAGLQSLANLAEHPSQHNPPPWRLRFPAVPSRARTACPRRRRS